jgi:hypothetical protein
MNQNNLNPKKLLLLSVSTIVLICMSSPALAEGAPVKVKSESLAPPATKLETTSLVSPDAARTTFGTLTTRTNGISVAVAASPELVAITRALLGKRNVSIDVQRDAFVKNTLDYVRNNINVDFRYGLSKGARGALIDQSGTSFDQAELMQKILQQGGVTSTLVSGDATLTANQFGKWSGLVQGLNDGTQAFTVNAKAACEMLADGGIPAVVNNATSCTSLTGNLTSVKLSHIWVQVAGVNYDPSYKEHQLRKGIDLPVAMGCGTQAASTCGSTVNTSGMTGATQGTTASGIPFVSKYNLTSAKTSHNTMKGNLSNYIKSQNINSKGVNASVWDVIGGKKLNPQTTANASLTYDPKVSWSAGIPDQYRTKLTVSAAACASFFADELAGRALLYKQNIQSTNAGYTVDNQSISNLSYVAAKPCPTATSAYIRILVDHPYPASSNSYADAAIDFKPVSSPSDETGYARTVRPVYLGLEGGKGVTPQTFSSSSGTFATDFPEQNYLSLVPMMIVHGFGQAGLSAQRSISDISALRGQTSEKCAVTTTTKLAFRDCNFNDLAVVAETFASMRTLTDYLVDGVAKAVTTRHHDVGIVYAGRGQSLSILSLRESLSVTPMNGVAANRISAFDMHALALSEAESRAAAIDSAPGLSAARTFFDNNAGSSGVTSRIYDIAPAKMVDFVTALPKTATVANPDGSVNYGHYCINYLNADGTLNTSPGGSQGCWRHLALQDVANQGYSTLIMEGAQSELFYKGNNERAFTMWEYIKGGTAIGNALTTAMKTTEVIDQSALRKKYLVASPASGEISIDAGPDIVTGSGDFPNSLSFARTFTPSHKEGSIFMNQYVYDSQGGGLVSKGSSYTRQTSGADSQYFDRIGGGWTHNYQVRLMLSNDLSYQLGSQNAFLATEMLTSLQLIKDLGTNGTLQTKITSLLAINNISRTLPGYAGGTSNTALVKIGNKSVTFHNTYNNMWFSSAEPEAKIEINLNSKSATYTAENGEKILFSPYHFKSAALLLSNNSPASPIYNYDTKIYKADQWKFPSGMTVDFAYTPLALSNVPVCNTSNQYQGEYGYLLNKVSNNLGRSLAFEYDKKWIRSSRPPSCTYEPGSMESGFVVNSSGTTTLSPTDNWTYALKKVTDENGRTVTLDNGNSSSPDLSYLSVADPLGRITRYEYTAGTDSPDPSVVVRNNYQLRRWFSPANTTSPYQSLVYDEMQRVSKIVDRNANATLYYPSGLYASEAWKLTELHDPVGNISLEQFDDKNGNIYSRNPLGNVTRRTFDNNGRILKTVMPEGDAIEQTYDVRGNVTRVCKIGKLRAGQVCSEALDIVTKTSYLEGISVLSCINVITCNKPLSDTDAKGNVTTYSWDGTHGGLLSVTGPSVTGGQALTSQSFTSFSSGGATFYLPTSKTIKIDAATSTTENYIYDSGNKYVLKEVIGDAGGLNLRTCLKYDTIGNLISSTQPKGATTTCP